MEKFKDFLKSMITGIDGKSVSSKIVIGVVCYPLLILTIIVLAFVNPAFPHIHEILELAFVTTASLLGIQTVENVKHISMVKKLNERVDEIEQTEEEEEKTN